MGQRAQVAGRDAPPTTPRALSPVCVFLAGLTLVAALARGGPAQLARQLLATAGVKGGFVVHVGCGDGRLTAALRASPAFVVQGLETDAARVQAARRNIRSLGLYGPVSVAPYDGRRLPYVDNLVNLLVVENPANMPEGEMMRVLAPGGVALVRAWPDGLDGWTHFLHGPDNNAVADDKVFGPPRGVQWVGRPRWTRDHDRDKGTRPAIRSILSANGRIFYQTDEATPASLRVPSRWFLVARDAFNGVVLWKKRLAGGRYPPRLERLWRGAVADGDRLYVSLQADGPLCGLDAATGKMLKRYDGTEGFQEVIKSGERLFIVAADGKVGALDASTGRVLWTWSPPAGEKIVPLTLAAAEGRAFLRTDNFLFAFAARDGEPLWKVQLEKPRRRRTRLRWPRERLIVADGVVLCSYGGRNPQVLNRDRWQYLGSHPRVNEYGGKFGAFEAASGKRLWQTAYRPGLESDPGDIFVVNGLVWLGPDFKEARDIRSGKVKGGRDILGRLWTTGHHHRCYPAKATCRYILTGKRGVEMIDIADQSHWRNNWVRGTCRVGILPANGLLYAPPHSCGCYMEAKLYGFHALRPKSGLSGAAEPAERLVPGPAYPTPRPSPLDPRPSPPAPRPSPLDPSIWPTFRHDPARSGSTPAPLGPKLDLRWKTSLAGALTAPVADQGRVLVAETDAHRLVCLDSTTGKPLWDFTAGGRIDSPPTIHRGLVLFGCRDGWVYCLRLSDGRPGWRFMAAPRDLRTIAEAQPESLWPVCGNVLVVNGVAYVAAGRSSYLDGGIFLYGLDPATGRVVCERNIRSPHTGPLRPPSAQEAAKMEVPIGQNRTDYKTFLAPDHSDAFSMSGALNDVLVADDRSVFLRQMRFNLDLAPAAGSRQHLFSTSSLLDDAENHRSHWVLGTGDFSRTRVAYPWILTSLAVPYGLLMSFDETTVWGVQRGRSRRTQRGKYLLWAARRPDPRSPQAAKRDFITGSDDKRKVNYLWTVDLAIRPRALVRAADFLFIAGMDKAVNPRDPDDPANATFEGRGPGVLLVASARDGARVATVALPAPPVWNGMAATPGTLVLTTAKGEVLCYNAAR